MAEINVLYCFDSKFWKMAAVSIESLLSTAAPETKITVYCMVAPHTFGRRKIQKIIQSSKSGKILVWREIKPSENPFQTYEYARWSPVIFYRCFAHRFFTDIDKLLYLDSDTLICKDVSDLYNTDLTDNVLGAVRDLAPVNDKYSTPGIFVKNFSDKYLNGGEYYNSGVLLLNIKKMAEYEHLLLNTNIPLYYPDQDLINAAFVDKIKSLPLKYNLAPGLPIPKIFPADQAKEALYGGHVIIHCYSVKPYDYDRAPDQLYDMFSKHAKAIGMDPKTFKAYDEKWAKKRFKKTFISHVKTQNNTIVFCGMKIKL